VDVIDDDVDAWDGLEDDAVGVDDADEVIDAVELDEVLEEWDELAKYAPAPAIIIITIMTTAATMREIPLVDRDTSIIIGEIDPPFL